MKKLFAMSAVTLAILAGCSAEQAKQVTPTQTNAEAVAPSVIISANDNRQYDTFTLPNSVEVMLVSDPDAEKSAAALSVSVGLLHDPMSQQGMAHYLEHMLFLGTERFPDTKGYTDFMTAKAAPIFETICSRTR